MPKESGTVSKHVDPRVDHRSLMDITRSKGPITKPCATPVVIVLTDEVGPMNETNNY